MLLNYLWELPNFVKLHSYSRIFPPTSSVSFQWILDLKRWFFRLQAQETSISSDPKRTVLRRWGEEPGYTEVLQQRAGSLNIRRSLLIKKDQISQVKEFSSFLCMGRCKSLGSLKSLFLYAFHLSWASILYFFHILSSHGAHHREQLQCWELLGHRYPSSWVP